ncbi:MAG: ParB/RepB/Spo0J family partition protein [Alphaproteobacteria bacterium]|nr:ParB/RepB/Spo0J family partition protein [Alphaproteobacteria bacterium]
MSAEKSESRGLGRGLAALLGEDSGDDSSAAAGHAAQELPLHQIHAGRFQPRHRFDDSDLEALAGSIREMGVLQPILVRPHPDIAGAYEIVAGERRWRAAQRAGVHEIPALVRDLADRDALEVALVENIQRENLSPLEEAQGYRRLLSEFNHTQEALSKVVGKSRSHVTNMMRLLGLPEPVKAMLDDGRLTVGHARALLNALDPVDLAHQAVNGQLNVRQTEELVRVGRLRSRPRRARRSKSADIVALERDLSQRLGLRVAVHDRNGKGEIVIRYATLEQLDGLLKRLGHQA